MTPEDRNNELSKLVANWFTTLATGIVMAGTFIPAAQFVFNLLPATTDNGLVIGVGAVCVVGGIALHLFGHVILGGFLR